MTSTLERNGLKADSQNDRFPVIAAEMTQDIYRLYVGRNGNSDILLRIFDGKAFTDIPVAATNLMSTMRL
jgi:hypothetical protein